MKKGFLYILVILCFSLCIFEPLTAQAADISTGVITGSSVAFRKEANIDSMVICRLDKGTNVKILSTNVNAEWDKVQYNGKTGYVNRMFVSWDQSLDEYNLSYNGTVINCKTNVNVRGTPSSTGNVLGAANKGDKLAVTDKNYSSGWCQVTYKGKTGYVSSQYLDISAAVDDTKLSKLSISGGTISPGFSPFEYGYVVLATSSKVTISARANSGVKVDVNGTGKSSASVSISSGSMKTVRIAINGKVTYTVYISKGVLTYGTYNIKRGDGNLLMQGRLIYDQHPDIMGIQEVFRNYDTSNIIDNLASLRTSNMPYTYFAQTIKYSGGGQYGIGMLSHYKMSNIKIYPLDSGGYEDRILVKAQITINGKKVSIYNTHFTYQSAAVRVKQFAQVLSVMNADTTKYKILTGDFNAVESEFATYKKNYNVIINTSTKYYDYTGNTFDNFYMDNIIVTKNIKVVNSKIINVALSDHFPVFAYLILK